MEKIKDSSPPRGLARLAWRAPIWLFRARLGWIFGKRFLLLTHTGRMSGLSRFTVLEVVKRDDETHTYYIASGFGEKSDWCRNITRNPQVTVQVGNQSWEATARRLTLEASEELMVEYAKHVPFTVVRNLARLMGYRIEDNEVDYRALGRVLPIFALVPI